MINGILEGESALTSIHISTERSGLVSYMENIMMDGHTMFLLGGLGVFKRLFVLTLSEVEEGGVRRFLGTFLLVNHQKSS